MGTAKRERQKANRQLRLQELAKQARKEKSKRMGVRIGLIVAAVVALVGAFVIFGGDDEETAATTTTAATLPLDTSTTVAADLPEFGEVPAKPTVELPTELPTELQVTTLREGTGAEVVTGDTVYVHYVGVRSGDGVEFDNSYERGEPLKVTVGFGEVITGWDEGLLGVQVGGMYQFDIPSDLAYGDEADPAVAGPLTFVVEVVGIVRADGTVVDNPAAGSASSTTVADTTPTIDAPATT